MSISKSRGTAIDAKSLPHQRPAWLRSRPARKSGLIYLFLAKTPTHPRHNTDVYLTNGRYTNLLAQERTSPVAYSQVAEIGALLSLSRRCKPLSTHTHAYEFRNQSMEPVLECVRHEPCVSNAILDISTSAGC
ncbi:hypothetical protein AG1IA_02151 [Rhizoctonia solani AG-1 IA]|uniref:Uncharacterized protein n=1 Tax=Thanatephorus cucumeris (strain AG1-IA) TaxID=983506 RepID=L8X5D7_THACA|nr:hypothetical protein AG1IA_02151 [Rhizoctonia solani AG-1 IA]